MGGTSPPESGFEFPANIRINVVFPVPFSPNITIICDCTNEPAFAVNSKFPAF